MQNHDRNVFHTVPHDADVGVWVRLVNGETLYQVKTSLVIGGTRTWIHDLIKLTLNLKNCFFIKTFDIYCFNVFLLKDRGRLCVCLQDKNNKQQSLQLYITMIVFQIHILYTQNNWTHSYIIKILNYCSIKCQKLLSLMAMI